MAMLPASAAAQENEAEGCSVAVAVRVRPLVSSELDQGCRSCLSVQAPQISTGQHNFTYDYVFGDEYGATDPGLLYPKCVAPLVEGLFRGYNATVFAYGQTGSGKTFTMGSEYKPGGRAVGVIPEAIQAIFGRVAASKDREFTVRVSFVEIHKEEVRDLLITGTGPRTAVTIREVPGGSVCLCGAVEREVRSQEEMARVLEDGSLCRATASTNMNNRSSRSHAIFTITLEQRRQLPSQSSAGTPSAAATNADDDDEAEDGVEGEDSAAGDVDDYLCAKLHLVDLAGSERAKRTKAEGMRLKEGIHINKGLLALGNVINAIVDNHKHVPYRDSKLTRLLQDSLGGNSRTLMIACVSPADVNFEESLNTLRYADRARHIRNKPTVNRDPVAAQVAALRQQISLLKAENMALRKALASEGKDATSLLQQPPSSSSVPGGEVWTEQYEQQQHEIASLEMENARIKVQMESLRAELAAINDKLYTSQAELDVLRATSQQQQHDHGDGSGNNGDASMDVLKGYLSRIAELEKDVRSLRSLQQLSNFSRRRTTAASAAGAPPAAGAGHDAGHMPPSTPLHGAAAAADGGAALSTPHPSSTSAGGASGLEDPLMGSPDPDDFVAGEELFYAEMAAHALEQEKMKQEMAALQRVLETKERKMSELMKSTGAVPALKQHYDRMLQELEEERDRLQKERDAIKQKLSQIQAASDEERKRIEAHYKERLTHMDEKLKEVRKKERDFMNLQKLKLRTEETCNRLNSDIMRLRQQKVALQKNMETSAKQFATWKVEREKEIIQLRRQNRRNVAQIQHLEAMQAKQNAVLQRKIADANAARKKLRELQGLSKQAQEAPAAQPGQGASSGAAAGANARGGAAAAAAAAAAQLDRSGSCGSAGGSASGAPAAANSSGVIELQPNAQAPLLRTEKARRDWLEKELDLCNQSFEYRRVLEGELAQRAEVNRQLREVEKRLMVCSNLVPPSPLVSGAVASAGMFTPMPNTQAAAQQQRMGSSGGDGAGHEDTRHKLLEKKVQLEKQLAEHHQQIAELQAAWERARQEEESRGGGAADVRRWTGIRNIIEARELLRTVFRVACDQKGQCCDLSTESVKLQEELDLMRVQLDAARKESEAQRKRAAAIEATAATAMATPFPPVVVQPSGKLAAGGGGEVDETDREVDDLLHQLQVAATTPVSVASMDLEADVTMGSPDGSCEVSIELPRGRAVVAGAGMEVIGQQLAKALTFGSALDNATTKLKEANNNGWGRYGGAATHTVGEDEDEEMQEAQDEEMEDGDDEEMGDASSSSSSEDEVQEVDGSDDEMDRDWDPSNPTPARKNRRQSQQQPQPLHRLASSLQQAPPPPIASQEPSSRLRSSSAGAGISLELPVIEDINRQRAASGLPAVEKLTVKLLKEHLAGRTLPDGKLWRAGSKTRDQLVQDYRYILGLQQVGSQSYDSGTAASTPMGVSWQPATSASLTAVPPPAARLPQPLPTSTTPSPSSSRDYRAAVLSSKPPPSASRPPRVLNSITNSPQATRSPRILAAAASPHSPRTIGSPVLRMALPSSPPPSEIPSLGGVRRGADSSSERKMTPLSMLYIQKAQEARERTALLRQSIQKANPHYSVTANVTSQLPAQQLSFGAAAPAVADQGQGRPVSMSPRGSLSFSSPRSSPHSSSILSRAASARQQQGPAQWR